LIDAFQLLVAVVVAMVAGQTNNMGGMGKLFVVCYNF
jgi:hypothetical protein